MRYIRRFILSILALTVVAGVVPSRAVAEEQEVRPLLGFITQRGGDVDANVGYGYPDFDLRILHSDGSVSEPVNPPNIWPRFFSISPDWTKIAFIGVHYFCAAAAGTGRCEVGPYTIYTVNVDGSVLAPIYEAAADDLITFPEWSPDGEKIAFVLYPGRDEKGRRPNSDIWILEKSVAGWTPRPFVTRRGDEKWPDWSPDGRYIAYEYHPDNNRHDDKDEPQRTSIGLSRTDGIGTHLNIGSGYPISHPTFSPDGRKIAFVDYPSPWASDGSEVGIMRIDGTGQRTLATSLKYPWALDFSPDGKEVAFGEGWKWEATRIMAVRVRVPHKLRVVVDDPTTADHLPKYFPLP